MVETLEDPEVSPAEEFQTLLVRTLVAGMRGLSWQRSLRVGESIGDLVMRLGVRRRTAEENLERAFPEWEEDRRREVLRDHYRELGRVAAEYARLAELVRAPIGEVIAEVRGAEHLEGARAGGRGAILLTGHFGNFELLGAFLGRTNPVDFLVRPLKNPGVEALIARWREAAGVGQIAAGAGIRRVYEALRANHWVAVLADQDARHHGTFVPFLGRPASTPIGPARLSLATGAPIIMGFCARRADGRHELDVDPPLQVDDPAAADAAERLTALHTGRLEQWVRRRPEQWFWLHRRWKTRPPCEGERQAGPAGEKSRRT